MKLIFSYLSTMPTNLFTLFFFIFFTLIKQGEAANYYPLDEKLVIDLCQYDSINSVDSIPQSTYLWESSLRPVAELDAQGQILARYVYGNRINVPEYIQKNGATYRFITDRLGSVRQVVNIHTGEIAQKLSYNSFGQVIENTNPDFQPFGFAGGIYDRHTGLVRFGARDYDANVGRWTDKEPLGFNAEMNFYRYAYNDPVNLADVDGNEPAAVAGALVDLGIQLQLNGSNFGEVNWGSVAGSAVLGAVTHGYSAVTSLRHFANAAKCGKASKNVLTLGQVERIQNASNRLGKPIHLVGSRAKGTSKLDSDWDYVIEGLNSKGYSKIKNSLPGAPSRIDGVGRNMDVFRTVLDKTEPYITFKPK